MTRFFHSAIKAIRVGGFAIVVLIGAAPLQAQLRLNEVVTANITGWPDENEADLSNCPVPDCERWYRDLGESVYDGDYPDWIEIWNSGEEPVDLLGYGLSDDPDSPFKWTFPSLVLEPGAFLAVFASGKDRVEAPFHTNFKLGREGETIALVDPEGNRIDAVETGEIPIDFSRGRHPDSIEDWILFSSPTPGAANRTPEFPGFAGEVSFSHSAGFYDEGFRLMLEGGGEGSEIRYTLDGGLPDEGSSLFNGSIRIEGTTVVRARTFLDGQPSSPLATQSYFIGETFAHPVISLTTDPANLWDPDLGIYTPGRNARESDRVANYWNDWERPVHLEFFEADRTGGFRLDAGLQIFGWGSRANPQKSLAVMIRDRYGSAELDYPLFPDLPVDRFKSFVLRAGGSDATRNGTFFRDPFATSLMKHRNVDSQAFRPAVVFLNGEYWGIHNIREKMNEDYLASHHNVDAEAVDIISRYWRRTYPVVIEGDEEAVLAFEGELNARDMRSGESFEWLKGTVDLENALDYFTSQIFFANYDWPGNNSKMWRPREPDSRWRWLMYDLDYTLESNSSQNNAFHDTLAHATQVSGPGWPNPPWTTLIFRKLLENPEFQNRFTNRMADLMNTVFLPSNLESRLDEWQALYLPEMPRHINRWRNEGDVIPSMSRWEDNLQVVRNFSLRRPDQIRRHLMNHFDLSGSKVIRFTVEPAEAGRIQVNSIKPQSFPWTGEYFEGLPIDLIAWPERGWRFAGWSHNGIANQLEDSPALQIDPQDAQEIAARFQPDPLALNAVVIHEIQYNPSNEANAGDWVELYNGYRHPVSLEGWRLKDEDHHHEFVFPEGAALPPGGFLIVCENMEAFQTQFSTIENAVGDLGFNLGNGGDSVRLYDPQGELADEIVYDDQAPWPEASDGSGRTLSLVEPDLDNADPQNWKPSADRFGTPGEANKIAASLPPPALRLNATDSGSLEFNIIGTPNTAYRLQRSADLQTWIDWQTASTLESGSASLTVEPESLLQFYRAAAAQ